MMVFFLFLLSTVAAFVGVQAQGSGSGDCASELSSYSNCLFRLDPVDGKACNDCIVEASSVVALEESSSCESVQTQLCTAVTETCTTYCGDCDDEVEAYIACDVIRSSSSSSNNNSNSNVTCEIDCGTVSTPATDDQPPIICNETLVAYATCVVQELSEAEAMTCDACRVAAAAQIPAGASCFAIEAQLCDAVADCPCGPCADALEAYFDCDVATRTFDVCDVRCRTTVANCPTSLNSYLNCIYRLEDAAEGKACDDCRLEAALELADTTAGGSGSGSISCELVQETFCTAVTQTCSSACGTCDDELEFYLACDVFGKSNGTCEISCGTTYTPPDDDEGPLCDEFTEYTRCVVQTLSSDEREACDTCRVAAEQSVGEDATCDETQTIICGAVQSCEVCGTCRTSLEEYWVCDLSKRTFGECQAECSIGSTTIAPTSSPPIANNVTTVQPAAMTSPAPTTAGPFTPIAPPPPTTSTLAPAPSAPAPVTTNNLTTRAPIAAATTTPSPSAVADSSAAVTDAPTAVPRKSPVSSPTNSSSSNASKNYRTVVPWVVFAMATISLIVQ